MDSSTTICGPQKQLPKQLLALPLYVGTNGAQASQAKKSEAHSEHLQNTQAATSQHSHIACQYAATCTSALGLVHSESFSGLCSSKCPQYLVRELGISIVVEVLLAPQVSVVNFSTCLNIAMPASRGHTEKGSLCQAVVVLPRSPSPAAHEQESARSDLCLDDRPTEHQHHLLYTA